MGSTLRLFFLRPSFALWALGELASPQTTHADGPVPASLTLPAVEDANPGRVRARSDDAWRMQADFAAPTHVFVVLNPEWPGLMEGLVRQISPTARIMFLQYEDATLAASRNFVAELPRHLRRRVDLLPLQVNSSWVRDYGPRVLQRGDALRWMDAHYDDERPLDDQTPSELGRVLRVPVLPSSLDLDGGGVSSNGDGLCLMTEHSWAQLGAMPSDGGFIADGREFGCDEVLILPSLAHEATGHADVFAQFIAKDHLLLARVDRRESSSDARRLERAHRRLQAWAESRGKRLTISRIDMPVLEGQSYYSYINGLQLADRYLAPRFKDVDPTRQRKIHEQLARAIATRPVVTIAANVLQELGGVIHCATLGVRIPPPVPVVTRAFGQARTRTPSSGPKAHEAHHAPEL